MQLQKERQNVQQLEHFYESTPKAVGFIERKTDIPSHTINLYGPPGAGKTWLVLDYINRLPKKRRLYVDMSDLRLDVESLSANLQEFIESNDIESVVLDHYTPKLPLPKCRQVITVTQTPFKQNPFTPLLEISSLDFEEYLAFERRHQSLEHSFSQYLRCGSLPSMAHVSDSLLTMELHKNIRSIFPSEKEVALFRYMARFQGKPLTPYQLYGIMKKDYKISKDWLYKSVNEMEKRGVVTWLHKFDQPKAAKKLLFYDFAMPASLYFEKSLMGQLQSIAAKKLQKRAQTLYYTDKIDFLDYEERRAILLSPFANQQSGATKVARIAQELESYNIKEVLILTIANSFAFTFEKRAVKAIPFYEWVLQD